MMRKFLRAASVDAESVEGGEWVEELFSSATIRSSSSIKKRMSFV